MQPVRTRPAGAPCYELRQVFSDGTESEPEFLPILDPPWEASTDRRGFLKAGLTAGAVLALLAACGPDATPSPRGGGGPSGESPSPTPSPSETPEPWGTLEATTEPTPKATKSPKPKKTPKPTPKKTPKPTKKPTTCGCHVVGGCSCNTICTCNKICTCMAICQAHRLLDPDPVVRAMAEQIVVAMGARETAYLRWAADAADPALQQRISAVAADIAAGARPDPARWPSVGACTTYLDNDDPVVAVMAAQMLDHHRTWLGADLGSLAGRVQERLTLGASLRWRPPE